MKGLLILAAVAALCNLAFSFVFGHSSNIFEERDVEVSNCKKFRDSSIFTLLKTVEYGPKTPDQLLAYFFSLNVTDWDAVKGFSCKIIEAETLQDVANAVPGQDYEEIKKAYKINQKNIGAHGGYTSAIRYYNARHDFLNMLLDSIRSIESPGNVSEAIDLPALTRLLEVMQVKYGSRFIALLTYTDNQEGVVQDPRKLATDLIESSSFEDFKSKQTSVTGMPEGNLRYFYEAFSVAYKLRSEITIDMERDLRAHFESIQMLGELGLYSLKY